MAEDMICAACKGKGHRAGYDDPGGIMRTVLEECDPCGGTGKVAAPDFLDVPCCRCGGKHAGRCDE